MIFLVKVQVHICSSKFCSLTNFGDKLAQFVKLDRGFFVAQNACKLPSNHKDLTRFLKFWITKDPKREFLWEIQTTFAKIKLKNKCSIKLGCLISWSRPDPDLPDLEKSRKPDLLISTFFQIKKSWSRNIFKSWFPDLDLILIW